MSETEALKVAIDGLEKALDFGEPQKEGGESMSVKREKARARSDKDEPTDEFKKKVTEGIQKMRRNVLRAILNRIVEKVKAETLSLLEAGVIESRLNKGIELDAKHWEMLGMDNLAKALGKGSSYDEQMKPFDKPVGSRALPIRQAGGRTEAARAEREPNSLSANRQGSGVYEFYSLKSGTFTSVSAGEVLKAIQVAVREGRCDLTEAGVLEMRVNHGGQIQDSTLRELFS